MKGALVVEETEAAGPPVAKPEGAETSSREAAFLAELSDKPLHKKLWGYTALSGPGWLQSAITLGGGSLAGALYLGVLGGFSLLWVQLVAMVMGIVMLSAIAYVTLSTGERPFKAINEHVSPVLGWAWALATLMANMVWCLPQFALGTAAVRQNLLPSVLGAEGPLGDVGSKLVVGAVLLGLAVMVVWTYDSGKRGMKFFEGLLKVMVGVIVVSFFSVVVKMSFSGEGLAWGRIFAGFIPDFRTFSRPAEAFAPCIEAVPAAFQDFWVDKIVGMQRNVMITAAATAVGINMTFLLPYSMLARGWGKGHRGLAIFDLGTGLLIPYILATTCVVVAAATQFHAQPGAGLLDDEVKPAKGLVAQYNGLLGQRLKYELRDEFKTLSPEERAEKTASLPEADKRMAAMLVKRDAFNLAASLERLTGKWFSHFIFGIGVLGMALSTIIILMLISGFVICEMLGLPAKGKARRWGSLAAAVGVLGPFIWSGKTSFWLAVPTSVFNFVLLPIAYLTFALLMNRRKLLGSEMPTGGRRIRWNALMGIAAGLATIGAVWSIWNKAHWYGVAVVCAFLALIAGVHFWRRSQAASTGPASGASTPSG
jgi:Mn2+/Fe2+ NRAMP family transporter